jgi:hypothetical protein
MAFGNMLHSVWVGGKEAKKGVFFKRKSKYGCLRAECVAIILHGGVTVVHDCCGAGAQAGSVQLVLMVTQHSHTGGPKWPEMGHISAPPKIRTSTAARHRQVVSKLSMILKMSSPPHRWATKVSWRLSVSKVKIEDPLNSTASTHIDNTSSRMKTPHDSWEYLTTWWSLWQIWSHVVHLTGQA